MLRRWLGLIGGGALLLLAMAGGVAFVASRDFNAYRGWAAARLSAELGLPVSITGDLGLSLGWTPVVIARAVRFGRPEDGKLTLARIERLEARIALMPFVTSFGRELVVESVALQGARLWLGRGVARDADDAPGAEPSIPALDNARMSVRLRSLEITDSVFHYLAGREIFDVVIAKATAEADGAAMRIAADGSFGGRALRVEGWTGALDQFLARPRQPVAVDLIATLGGTATLHVAGKLFGDGIDFALQADIRELGNIAAISSAQPLALSARVQAPNLSEAWRLTDVTATLGTLAIAGEATLQPGETPDLRVKLRTAHIDLAPTDAAAPRHDGKPAFPSLDWFTAEVALAADSVTLPQGVRLTELRSLLVVREGKAELKEFAASLAGGSVGATGNLTSNGEFTARLDARGFDLGQVIREARGRSALTGGKTVLRAELQGRLDGADIIASLKGRADVSVGRASVSNAYADRFGFLQIFNLIDRALPLGSTVPVTCAAGRFTVDGGVARTRGLMIDSPRLALWVTGRVDLASQAINFRVEPQPKVASLISVVPPANIRGTLGQPIIEPDVIGAAVGVAGNLLSTPGLMVEEVGDVLSSLGAFVTGSTPRSARAAEGCRAPGQSPRETRPGLRIPNPLDLFR